MSSTPLPTDSRLTKLEELGRLKRENKILTYYPDEGPLRRELYPKHLQFFTAGREHRERAFLAANKIGKSEGAGGYETALHLTGLYPAWWSGRRFERGIQAWAAGKTGKDTKDIIQSILLGRKDAYGTGMIPKSSLISTSAKPGVPDAVDTIYVKHISGTRSEITLKSFDQGRESFQGTNKHLIWLDEECDQDVYVECLLRTMTTDGMVMITFTPLQGMTALIQDFLGIKAAEA